MSQSNYRSIFISDLHLGTKNCKAEYLLDFLRSTESEYLYLVGDIFDLWEMKKSVYWTASQNEIIREIFHKAENGTQVVYIPGNHDAWFRKFVGSRIHGISLQEEVPHLIGADHLLLGVNLLGNIFFLCCKCLTGFGARYSALPHVCPIDSHDSSPEIALILKGYFFFFFLPCFLTLQSWQ